MNYDTLIKETQAFADELLTRMNTLQRWRSILSWSGAFIIGLAIVLGIFNDKIVPYMSSYKPIDLSKMPKAYYLYSCGGIGGFGLFLLVIALTLNDDTLRIRRAKALADISAYSAIRSYSATNAFIDSLGQVVLSHLTQFFSFVLSNVQRSSRLTSAMMTVGFVLIAAGISIGVFAVSKEVISYVTSGAGLLLELLTSVILVFNRESVDLMNNYMKKLENFSQTLLALSLLDTAQSEEYREYMRQIWFSQIVQVLSGPSGGSLIGSPPNPSTT